MHTASKFHVMNSCNSLIFHQTAVLTVLLPVDSKGRQSVVVSCTLESLLPSPCNSGENLDQFFFCYSFYLK